MYIHTSRDAVRAAAALDLSSRSPPTQVVNAENLQVALPYIPRCWSLEAEHLTDVSVLPETLRNRAVIIWIHGFRQRFFRVASVAHHVLRRCTESSQSSDGSAPLVIPFLWPCHLKGVAYMRARDSADKSAQRLERLLHVLQLLSCHVVVLSHSLGCRLALRALSQSGGREGLVEHLVLLGAAVAADAMAASGEFPRTQVAARRITVLHSSNDEVLRGMFQWGEAASGWLRWHPQGRGPEAMGLRGPTLPLPARTQAFDVSASVPAHNPNLWLRSVDVMARIMELMPTHVMGTAGTEEAACDVAAKRAASADPLNEFSDDEDLEEDELGDFY